MCPDLVAFDSAFNPYRVQASKVQTIPSAILHTLVSTVYTHRLIQRIGGTSRASGPQFADAAIYRHRGAAIRSLNQILSSSESATNDVFLASILIFLLAEVCSHHFRVFFHLLISMLASTFFLWRLGTAFTGHQENNSGSWWHYSSCRIRSPSGYSSKLFHHVCTLTFLGL